MKPWVVVGQGWSALGAVGFLLLQGKPVCWILGQASRSALPLSCLPAGKGVAYWLALLQKLELNQSPGKVGHFIREWKHKSFRQPSWVHGVSSVERQKLQRASLWKPEQHWVGVLNCLGEVPWCEWEERLRHCLCSELFPDLRIERQVPVVGIDAHQQRVQKVILGSGELIECESVVYADRWYQLTLWEGLPRPLPFLRNREAFGALQADWTHPTPWMPGVTESFLIPLPRESGDTDLRHVVGYFFEKGRKSHWTLCLTPQEVQDNHEIAKKFRKMKSVLDRVFSSPGFLPEGVQSWASTLTQEQVRLIDEFLWNDLQGSPEGYTLPELQGFLCLTDGYGPEQAFYQVGIALGIDLQQFQTQAEDMNVLDTSFKECLSGQLTGSTTRDEVIDE